MDTQDGKADRDVWLVYDGECPICRTYCVRARIQDSVGRLHLVDAREPGPLMDEITTAGLDIDQGMVVKLDGVLYYGPEAMRVLTLMATRAGWFNRVSRAFFGGDRSRWSYPLAKALRNVLLRALGIPWIDNLGRARGAVGGA
jgi:predicted DCC family thiol-disulfide oxidoreductase YuxK